MTSQALQITTLENLEERGQLILFAEVSPAKRFQSQENEEDLTIQEVHSFLKSRDLQEYSNLSIYSLRTSKDSSITNKEEHLKSSSKRWMNWGMMRNGSCSTAKILEFPKTGNACTLSDILEVEVDEKYFLSDEQTAKLLGKLSEEVKVNVFTMWGGLSVTLSSQGGGSGAKTGLYLMDLSKTNPKITDIARTLQARYNKGIANRQAEVSGVLCLGNINPSGRGMNGQVFDSRGLSPTITTNKGEGNKIAIPVLTPERIEKRQNGRRFKTNGEPMFTLTGQDRHGVAILQKPRGNNRGGVHEVAPTVSSHSYQENNHLIDSNMRIRKLTPLECFRLQGYPDVHWKRAKEAGVSDSQLYKQAGNGVTKNVVYEIAKRF